MLKKQIRKNRKKHWKKSAKRKKIKRTKRVGFNSLINWVLRLIKFSGDDAEGVQWSITTTNKLQSHIKANSTDAKSRTADLRRYRLLQSSTVRGDSKWLLYHMVKYSPDSHFTCVNSNIGQNRLLLPILTCLEKTLRPFSTTCAKRWNWVRIGCKIGKNMVTRLPFYNNESPAYLVRPPICAVSVTQAKQRPPGAMQKATEWTPCPGRLCESGTFGFPDR